MTRGNTVAELISVALTNFQNREAFVHSSTFRSSTWTFADVQKRIEQIQNLLEKNKIKKGDKVLICAPNSPWWVCIYFACAEIGVVVVPVDFSSSSEFMEKIAKQSGTKLVFISVYKSTNLKTNKIIVEDLMIELKNHKSNKRTQISDVRADDVLEIVYTSGSTGDPKGVVLTQGNVASNVSNFLEAWDVGDSHVLLSLIPLSHMFEQTVGLLAPFVSGSKIVYISSIKPSAITAALKKQSVTTLIIVPAFLSLLRRRIVNEAESAGKSKTLKKLLRIAKTLPNPIRRLLFKPVLKKIGPDLRYIAVGGAALPVELEEFWTSLGIHILQGYGLTETSPISTYSLHTNKKPGSVGHVLPNQEIKISNDGEILIRGPHVFKGYYKNKSATQQTVKDGWFYTGDIGEFDENGFLFLRGRKKNMLLSENGLNIYPEDIEAEFMNNSTFTDVCVLMSRDGKNDVLSGVFCTQHPQSKVEAVIKTVNQKLAAHQIIQRVIIYPEEDFPRTATRKVKRKEVQAFVDNQHVKATGKSQKLSPVEEVIANVVSTKGKIKKSHVLMTDLGVDSLKLLELVTAIEEKLFVVVGEDQIAQNTTVQQLEEIVEKARKNPHITSFALLPSEKKPLSSIKSAVQGGLLVFPSMFQQLNSPELPRFDEPVIFVSNHTSHFDSLTYLRWHRSRRKYLAIAAAKDYFFSKPLNAFFARRLVNAFPLDRSGNIKQSLTAVGAYLDAGTSVLIFPEGTRSPDGNLQNFKPGIGLIAQQLDMPVVPVRLRGNYEIMPKGAKWPKRGTTKITVGQPMIFSHKESIEDISKEIKQALESL